MSLRRCIAGMALLAGACAAPGADSQDSALNTSKPHVIALSTYSASLGTAIDAYMINPPGNNVQKFELVFDGTFKRRDGKEERVQMTQPAQRVQTTAVRWTQFGPYGNPFTKTNPDIGSYDGKVGLKVTLADGSVQMDEAPLPIHLEVKPSIVITELQPVGASCDAPAIRLIGGLKYKMKTQMLGFDGVSVDYEFKIPGIVPDSTGAPSLDLEEDNTPKFRSTQVSHLVADNKDAIDEKDAFELPFIPDGIPTYGVIISMAAKDAQGGTVRSAFGMLAHKPLETAYDGREEVAQIYPPEPVSACYPGGQQGRNATYDESTAVTKTKTLSITLMSNWSKTDEHNWSTQDGHTFSTQNATTNGYQRMHSDSNSFTFEKTEDTSFSWNWTANGQVNAKIPFTDIGATGGGSGGQTRTKNDGTRSSSTQESTDQETRDHQETTTDTSDVSHTTSKGGSASSNYGAGENQDNRWEVSSTETIQKGFGGQIIAEKYGVFYRQMTRMVKKAFVLEFNACGQSDIIGDVVQQDYKWAPDLAIGTTCSPLPPSNFPKAQCLLQPCDNN